MNKDGSGKTEIRVSVNMIVTILKVKNFSFPRTMLRAELLVIEGKKAMLRGKMSNEV